MPFIPLRKITSKTLRPAARGHEIAMNLARDPDVARLLQDLSDDPELRSRAAEDPMQLVRDRELGLPDGSTVSLLLFATGWEILLTVEEGGRIYTYGYNSAQGFYHR